jgi:hypothetical protein
VTLAKVAAATAVMAAVTAGANDVLAGMVPGEGFSVRTLRLLTSIAAGLASLAAAAKLLRIQEFDDLAGTLKNRRRP